MSRERMVVETWLTPQNDHKIEFSEVLQANYTHTTEVPQKLIFWYLDVLW